MLAAGSAKYRRIVRDNHPNLTTDQFGCQCRNAVILAVRKAVVDRDVLSLDVTCLT